MEKKKRVLIIEDDTYTRELFQEVLEEIAEITTAVDGEEGLFKAQAGGYHLILLDIMMPKLDGIQILESLKNKPPQNPNGPIILLTNMAYDTIVKKALELGAKSYLIKADLNPETLTQAVKKFLA